MKSNYLLLSLSCIVAVSHSMEKSAVAKITALMNKLPAMPGVTQIQTQIGLARNIAQNQSLQKAIDRLKIARDYAITGDYKDVRFKYGSEDITIAKFGQTAIQNLINELEGKAPAGAQPSPQPQPQRSSKPQAAPQSSMAERQRKAAEQSRKAQEARAAKPARNAAEEEQQRKQAQEARRQSEAERQRQAEEARQKAEAGRQRKAEQERKAEEARAAKPARSAAEEEQQAREELARQRKFEEERAAKSARSFEENEQRAKEEQAKLKPAAERRAKEEKEAQEKLADKAKTSGSALKREENYLLEKGYSPYFPDPTRPSFSDAIYSKLGLGNNASRYQILGLTSEASLDDVKNAYRTLFAKWHPDRNSDPDANEVFKLIGWAYLPFK